MGNNSTKESRGTQGRDSRDGGPRPTASDAVDASLYTPRSARANRHDAGILGLGSSDRDPALEPRRETRPEREARKAEKERVARAKERERSMREEGVDGGYLVTLGTYVGPEDFSRSTVRKLQIERRLAPFWRGLNDHSSSWTEHQLVAAARGKPIPAPDEIPPEDELPVLGQASTPNGGQSKSTASIPINQTSDSNPSAPQNVLSASANAATLSTPEQSSSPPPGSQSMASPLFRGRAKTLASLASKNSSYSEITPQEIQLPKNPQINGQPVEAYLYKDVVDCPICFLSYPQYLNQTRCCDQPICSECFVQIKRPDPHPPEHVDPNAPPETQPKPWEEEGQFISEPATCPFCVQPSFGVTYDPPPFRRGLAYPGNERSMPHHSRQNSQAGSSPAPGNRRRTESLSADAPSVITTDMVRPDWAEKLADARAHAARRSAAATALHNAAYLTGDSRSSSGFSGIGRRRRMGQPSEGSGNDSERPQGLDLASMNQLLAALEGQSSSRGQRRGTNDLFPGRVSSRNNRADDLEEIMMMEAIRQSIAAEEERKRKEEKDAAKAAKKEEKQKARDEKKAAKAARKNSGIPTGSANSSGFFNLGSSPSMNDVSTSSNATDGKGKAKATTSNDAPSPPRLGWNPLAEPTSTLNAVPENERSSFSSRRSDHRSSEKSPANSSDRAPRLPSPSAGGTRSSLSDLMTRLSATDEESTATAPTSGESPDTKAGAAPDILPTAVPAPSTASPHPLDQKHSGEVTTLENASEHQHLQ